MVAFGTFAAGGEPVYAAEAPADHIVRVALTSYGEPASFSMRASGAHTVADNGAALSGAFTVEANSAGILLVLSGGGSWQLDGDVLIAAGSASTENLIQISGAYKFAGDLRIVKTGSGLKLINHVNLDTYVAGVLPYEMNSAWPVEALKAQAVAARTYAVWRMKEITRAAVSYDLTNGENSQVYNGWNDSYTNVIAAVKQTKNQVLQTPSGGAVYACYSASNGGYTETGAASGAAARDYDYLAYKEDPYDLAMALGSTAYSGKVTIPKTLAAKDVRKSNAQPYKMIRTKLKSAGVNVAGLDNPVTVKSVTLTTPRYSNPDRAYIGVTIKVRVPKIGGASAKTYTLKFAPYKPAGSKAKYPYLNKALGLGTKFQMYSLREDGDSWLLAVVRYGHGAGLSQIGAYQMAKKGMAVGDILAFYYGLGEATKLVEMPWPDVQGGASTIAAPTVVTAATKSSTKTVKVNLTGKVKVDSTTVLNVRKGAGLDYKVIGALKNGTKVKISREKGDWYRIKFGSGYGWVNKAYVKV